MLHINRINIRSWPLESDVHIHFSNSLCVMNTIPEYMVCSVWTRDGCSIAWNGAIEIACSTTCNFNFGKSCNQWSQIDSQVSFCQNNSWRKYIERITLKIYIIYHLFHGYYLIQQKQGRDWKKSIWGHQDLIVSLASVKLIFDWIILRDNLHLQCSLLLLV